MTTRTHLAGALALWAATSLAQAQPVPPPAFTTGSCISYIEASQRCGSHGALISTDIHADLSTLSAMANIDLNLPYSTLAYANLYYFVQLFSGTGSFSTATVPIVVSAAGTTAVGDSGVPGGGTPFNHNTASATVKAFDQSFWACSGYQCGGNPPPSAFSGPVLINVRPGSSGSGVDPNIWRIEVSARADTNSSYQSSFAHAWADPLITIEPGYAAAHPEVSLIFSANLPVPEPARPALMLVGLAAVGLLARRRLPA